jgi:hypothetical protein
MTGLIGQSSDAALEDGLRFVGDKGYTDEGKASGGVDSSDDPYEDAFWIKRARESFETGQRWFDTSIRRRMEDNMRLFNSDHPRGSRYNSDAYQKRSKLFRPKTRASVRKLEAAAAAAFFATADALTTTPPNPKDKMQRLAADADSELLNYRLSTPRNGIPWFLTCIGALQDAAKQSVVISKQVWVYREVENEYDEEFEDEMGQRHTQITYENKVLADHPDIVLRPVENILFSAAADWRNPLQTSPYLIDQEPFYAGEIVDRGRRGAQGPYDVAFRKLDMGTIRSALKQSYDPVRQAREGNREDRYSDPQTAIQENDIVWVHHNYIRIEGQEWYYATLGTEVMLTDPIPLEETTPLKERPYVLGYATFEPHTPYPKSLVELGRPIQEEINDNANLRIDNIRHIISPRYFIKRGTSVDVRSLLRNIAGGVTAMEDPKNDVEIRQIADTTRSSFEEQDRLSVEMDDVVGSFSQSTVASNHNVTQRVGNTAMLGESANQITELTIRTFSETWAEPVLQQIMELERALESDEVVMAIVGQKMGIPAEQVFRMLQLPVKVSVNVGFGATNPQHRLQKVAMGFETLASINPEWVARADQGEVVNEVMGALGFKSGERFFPDIAGDGQQADPMMQQLMQENEELKGMLQGEGQKHQVTLQAKGMELESRERIEMAKLQTTAELQHKVAQNNWNSKLLDNQIATEQNEFRRQELIQQRIALNHTITMDEYQLAMAQQREEQAQYIGGDHVDVETGEPTQHANKGNGLDKVQQAGTGTSLKEPSPPNPREAKAKEPSPPKEPEAKGGGRRIANQPKIGSEDKAGVIARGRYGNVPFKEG